MDLKGTLLGLLNNIIKLKSYYSQRVVNEDHQQLVYGHDQQHGVGNNNHQEGDNGNEHLEDNGQIDDVDGGHDNVHNIRWVNTKAHKNHIITKTF